MHVLFIFIDCGFLEFFKSARYMCITICLYILYYYMPLHLFTVALVKRDILIIKLKVVNKSHNRKFYSFFNNALFQRRQTYLMYLMDLNIKRLFKS
jgi:hypothetical protein